MKSVLNRFSVAPMLDWTDRHCRYFHRQLTQNSLLYTEMVTTGAIIYGKRDYLFFNQEEMPVALQLGGSDPEALAICARKAEEYGYSEINLNVGCPSDRVQNGFFGACLMAKPDLVAKCIEAMQTAVNIPVSVKTRIGIDHLDSYEFLSKFIELISAYTPNFIIHARKAWLSGLSPKQNREIPPLDYERVYQLKRDYPHLMITLNGGVNTIQDAKMHLDKIDGVMMGRAAYHNPFCLTDVDSMIFGQPKLVRGRVEIIQSFYPYIENELSKGTYLKYMTRHIISLFDGLSGSKQWRRYISENAYKKDAGIEVIEKALSFIE